MCIAIHERRPNTQVASYYYLPAHDPAQYYIWLKFYDSAWPNLTVAQ